MPVTGNAVGIAFLTAVAVSMIGWRTVVTILGLSLVVLVVIGFTNVVNIMSG
ncbi:hypothetical protein Lesp02_32930 [Lentzea sp. NBRC 105346]|nr:hypothetical protein Lesp02_32930 [Lentzea sp. NBRC 105346]